LEKHIITLKNIEDNESFYNDMEKSGYVNEHIPERSVECDQRLEYTSNVIYFITREEAAEIKRDPRVWDVIAKSDIPDPICPAIYTSGAKIGYTTGTFKEFYRGITWPTGRDQYNMALLRYGGEPSGKRWGSNTSADPFDYGVISQNWTGQNIDIVTLEGGAGGPALDEETGVNINHPEFLDRFTGLTRVKKLDWSLYGNAEVNDTLNYSTLTDTNLLTHHAAGTLSTAGGMRGGFAKDANLYCAYATSTGIWNAIISWHNSKSVNPNTGYKNPTILITEYFYTKNYLMKVSDIEQINYRGTTYNKPSSGWTVDQLESYKLCPYYAGGLTANELVIPFGNRVNSGETSDTFDFELSDVQNAVSAGIHVFCPLGNQGYPMAYSGQDDYDNWIKPETGAKKYTTNNKTVRPIAESGAFGSGQLFYYMRPVGPSGSENGINVAALFPSVENYLESYTSKGPCTHICSPGSGQFSASPGKSYVPGDTTNEYGYFSGTSAATPFAAGIAACYLEYDVVSKNSRLPVGSWGTNLQSVYPLYTPVELRNLLIEKAETTSINDPTTPLPVPVAGYLFAERIPDIGNDYNPATTLQPSVLNGSRINFRTMGTPDRIIKFPKEDREATIPSVTRTKTEDLRYDLITKRVPTPEELAVSRAVEAALPTGVEKAALVRIGEEVITKPVGFGGRNNGGNAKNTRQEISPGAFALAQAGGGGSGWKGGGGGNLGGGGGGGSGFARDVSGTSVRSGKADTGGNSSHGFIRIFLNETGPGERPSTDVDPIGPNV
jgi:Subtilase family